MTLINGLVGYTICLAYLGFWFGLGQIRDTMTMMDRWSLIIVSTIVMPVVVPLAIIAGLRRMFSGQIVILDVVETRDGKTTEHRIVWPV